MNEIVFLLGLSSLIVGIVCDFYLVLVLSVSKLEPKSIRKLEAINLLIYVASAILIIVGSLVL
jgi:hypothetical protein